MKRKITYTDAPPEIEEAIENGKIIANFLPPPEQLVLKRSIEEVTIPLTNGSLDFYKRYARKQKTSFKEAICKVLDNFALQNASML